MSLLLVLSCSQKSSNSALESSSVPVEVATVEICNTSIYFETIGLIEPAKKVEVRPQISGRLKASYCTEGTVVNQGELLFSFDEVDYQIELDSAKSTLKRDFVELEYAKKDLERAKQLYQHQALSPVEYEKAEKQIALAEATIKQDQMRLAKAQLNLERCQIRAPITGRLGRAKFDVGNLILDRDADVVLIEIEQLTPLAIRFAVPGEQLAEFEGLDTPEKMELLVSSPEHKLMEQKGELSFVASHINPKLGVLEMRALLKGENSRLWPGQYMQVRLLKKVINNAIVIPADALKKNQNGHYVFVIQKDGTATLKPVEAEKINPTTVIVKKGLEAGEQVVTEGHVRIIEGSKVHVIDSKSSQTEASV
ncbi:MAG: efflux transporter, family, subunit [Chlamydiales bacterium]|jgi:multidrug efflux system membrane fusion protein|nr:efflux transporter, family, subunit [Chlamydiales bacterium]